MAGTSFSVVAILNFERKVQTFAQNFWHGQRQIWRWEHLESKVVGLGGANDGDAIHKGGFLQLQLHNVPTLDVLEGGRGVVEVHQWRVIE